MTTKLFWLLLFSYGTPQGIACLESSRPFITTPTGATFSSVFVDESRVCIVSILRAGDALAEAAQACIPHAPVGKVNGGVCGCFRIPWVAPYRESLLFY